MLTSRDVAAQAGVSQATVSRVISGSPLVTENTRRRVLEAMAQMGYQPNHAARAMRTQRSGTIGVVVADVLNPFYPAVIAAASRDLSRRGQRLLLWESDFGEDHVATEAIAQRLVDGLLFTTAVPSSPALLGALAAAAPIVLLNRTVPGLACDQIDSNNQAMSFDIARYFAAAGHERVGLISADQAASTASLREKGFREGVAASGLRLRPSSAHPGGFSHKGGHRALIAMISARGPTPTAVFCVNDLSALGALDAARSLGIRVPEDLWIVGYDDIDMASWEAFDLSTARQPVDAMVSCAVDLLLARIEAPTLPFRHFQFPATFAARGSTAAVPFLGRPTPATDAEAVVVSQWDN